MRCLRCLMSLAMALAWAGPAAGVSTGSPEEAREAFAQGREFIAQGEIDEALAAFKKAARSERGNEEYAQWYALLRQVVQLRKKLPSERDGEKWLSGAAALHAFYHENGLFAESLPLDRERLGRAPSPESAVMLAKTQLALQMNSETANMLESLVPDSQTPHTRVLHALALARMGQLDRAKAMVSDAEQGDFEAPDYFLDLARAQVELGQPQDALRAVRRSIELTPLSRLEDHKALLNSSADFASLAGTTAFAEVMKTSSTVKESPCSGGSGCGKCPKRAKCTVAHPAPKAETP